MDQKAVVKLCKEAGCCDACCLRYLGVKNPMAYENSQKFITKYQDEVDNVQTNTENPQKDNKTPKNNTKASEDEEVIGDGNESPPAKRSRPDICISCLGILQKNYWPDCYSMVKEELDRKQYECKTFACALSAPIATLLRERAMTLRLGDAFPDYDPKCLTALKESWKWSFGVRLSEHVALTLDSGAVSPLLITLTMEYPDEMQELEILKTLSPSLFESRSRQRRKFTVEFTRRSVEQALDGVTHSALVGVDGWSTIPTVGTPAKCISVVCTHSPLYLGGRYIKLSRELPQSPWILQGKRMMESSVQEIIFEPIAHIYKMSPEESEHRLKFMSAGREDVDVRCLGDGRPFAIEITDPRRELTAQELSRACEQISKGGKVIVKLLVHITRDDLVRLKQGEETKTKSYEALCIKLSHSEDDDPNGPITVTPRDIANINSYTNCRPGDARVSLRQRTPIRVLHRRPLLTRTRHIYELSADRLPDHPTLFTVRVSTQAGTYIKEWVHGELRRTQPSLSAALRATADILALDVTAVNLAWPHHTD